MDDGPRAGERARARARVGTCTWVRVQARAWVRVQARGALSRDPMEATAAQNLALDEGDASSADASDVAGSRLLLPSDDPEEWARVVEILSAPVDCPADLDTIQTKFAALDREPRVGSFFGSIPGTIDAGKFNFEDFFSKGAPLMVAVALEMPTLFDGVELPIFKSRSAWGAAAEIVKHSVSLTRRQCACLLAHSFFGSLKRPAEVQPNDFRFTVVDLFIGTAVTPNSATTFLNYFTVLGRDGFAEEDKVIFERQGYCKGPSPWTWDGNAKPLSKVELVDGSIDDCPADLHVEFANCYPGGGVMSGDAAQEETLFLVKPELMVSMALMNRMVDEEVVAISGAVKYARPCKCFRSDHHSVRDQTAV